MITRFQEYITKQNLCKKTDRILLTVSGGADSVVMLDLFHNTGYNTAIAHCNFHLRGTESDKDEQFVRELGKKYGVDVFVKHFDTKEYAALNNVSIQVAARDLRYAWFEELRQKKGFDVIAMGHHTDDQIETFFINLFRGSGLAGLKGMPIKRDHIIRPLLFAGREDIEVYAKKHNISFRDDSSNKEEKYLRNKIRHRLAPVLSDLTDNYPDAVIDSLNNLREADTLLQLLLHEKFDGITRQKDDTLALSKAEFRKLQPADVWSYYLLRRFGFNRSTSDNVADAVVRGQSGKLFYSETHQLLVDRDELLIKPLQKNDKAEYRIDDGQQEITEPVHLIFQTVTVDDDFSINAASSLAQLDKDRLVFPLKLRKWQSGDKIKPLGMSGSKLLSDYFIDNKMSLFAKSDIWLLLSEKDIVWIIGHSISDDYKITSKTREVLAVRLM
ncbi:MAG: tRNA lysidine(34) synthetase TilS [Bacteroidetes bacterium]|nr:MAG: tRNA lysidine(34) synthetase TilS [Bacteroidota bacterium]